MIDKVPTLVHLLKQLQQVPYLASKNIYRVANHLLTVDQHKAEQLCAAILQARAQIARCEQCHVWQEKDRACVLCSAPERNKTVICVVETWQEVLTIERAGGYNGLYHVLGGAICPLEGIGAEDLTITELLQRVETQDVREVILATNQTPEGEATAAYIASKFKNRSLTISCLARGMPVGASLEYMDRLTIYKALAERRPF
jgi:recombination protein RecR